MRPEEVMNADMPSEILLVVSGSLIFVTLLLILVAALTQTAALP
jgi:CHASE1-domain containing sensor protein